MDGGVWCGTVAAAEEVCLFILLVIGGEID